MNEEIAMNNTAFGANLTHLRTARGLTQEQLAETLGVSRQSVSKWESGVCLPELATLDTLCTLFGTTLDTLLRGSVRQTDLDAVAAFDAAWDRFAVAVTAGTSAILLGIAVSGFALGLGFSEAMSGFVMFLFLIAGVVCLVSSGIQHDAFTKAHPAEEVFYPPERRAPFDARFPWLMSGAIGGVLADVALMMLLTGRLGDMLSGSVFMLLLTVCVAVLVWGGMQRGKYDAPDEARRMRDDPDYARRERSIGRIAAVLWILTVAVYLVWSFVWDAWKISWLVFPVAGLMTGAVGAALSKEE